MDLYQKDRARRTDADAWRYENKPKFQAPPFWELPLDWLSPVYVFDVRPPPGIGFPAEGSEAPEGSRELDAASGRAPLRRRGAPEMKSPAEAGLSLPPVTCD